MAELGQRRRLTGTLGVLALLAAGLGYVPHTSATAAVSEGPTAAAVSAPGNAPMPVADPDTIPFRNKAGDRRHLTYGTVGSSGSVDGEALPNGPGK